jgi:hypothetical protein
VGRWLELGASDRPLEAAPSRLSELAKRRRGVKDGIVEAFAGIASSYGSGLPFFGAMVATSSEQLPWRQERRASGGPAWTRSGCIPVPRGGTA